MKRFIPLILLFASAAFGQTVVNGTCSVTVPATSQHDGAYLLVYRHRNHRNEKIWR